MLGPLVYVEWDRLPIVGIERVSYGAAGDADVGAGRSQIYYLRKERHGFTTSDPGLSRRLCDHSNGHLLLPEHPREQPRSTVPASAGGDCPDAGVPDWRRPQLVGVRDSRGDRLQAP